MKVDNLTPVLAAAPGERATCRLRIENTESAPQSLPVASHRVRRRQRAAATAERAACCRRRRGGRAASWRSRTPIAAGHHSIAVEVLPDRPGVGTRDRRASPSRSARSTTSPWPSCPRRSAPTGEARFRVDIDNRSRGPVDLELAGEGPDLDIRLRPDRLVLRPGERVRTSGRVKGPRHVVGEPLQHSMTVTARSRSAPSYAPATFQQRPLFPRGLRSLLAVLLVVGDLGRCARCRVPLVAQPQRRGGAGDGRARRHRRRRHARHAGRPARRHRRRRGRATRWPPSSPSEVADGCREGSAAARWVRPPHRTVMGGTVQAGESGDSSGVDRHAHAARSRGAAGGDGERRRPPRSIGTAGRTAGYASCGRRGSGATSRSGVSAVRQTVVRAVDGDRRRRRLAVLRRRRRPELRAQLRAARATTPRRSS